MARAVIARAAIARAVATGSIVAGLAIAGPAHAFDWPWQERQSADYSFCRGFVHAGLAALPVENLSRIQLWLAWNEVTLAEFERGALDQGQYEAGKARFSSLLESSDIDALLRAATGECAVKTSL
jgi:hypothetical protein